MQVGRRPFNAIKFTRGAGRVGTPSRRRVLLSVGCLPARRRRLSAARSPSPCRGPCYKECDPASVRSIANARMLKGCTIINGSLEIEIHSGATDVVERELTAALGQIQVIRGSLVVSRYGGTACRVCLAST